MLTIAELYQLIAAHPHGIATTALIGRVTGATLECMETARLIYIARASTPVNSLYANDGMIALPSGRYPAVRVSIRQRIAA